MSKSFNHNRWAQTLDLHKIASKKPGLVLGLMLAAFLGSLYFCQFLPGPAWAQETLSPGGEENLRASEAPNSNRPKITRSMAFQKKAPLPEEPAPAQDSGKSKAPKELTALREGQPVSSDRNEESGHIRERALREVALSSAIQAGARWRYQRILSQIVTPREKLLDELFDFTPLVSDNGKLYLIPPVATSAGEAIRLADSRTALGQDKSYSLISKAKLAGIAPNWRHYLMNVPQGPPEIHKTLRPKGGLELKKWKKEVDRGWKLGLEQADRLFASNLAELSRDYLGMMIFKRLVFEDYARQAGTQETITDLEVKEREIVFKKTLYELVGQEGFVKPKKAP
ncbi:MAG: type IV secretion system DotC family protein [Deltaproteobacteria bacterium]|jgi:defect-in-organelle-trafficking protein DotC|nr:type IV secretion system DotC family protein [Deltaproteobacteria bacterium]